MLNRCEKSCCRSLIQKLDLEVGFRIFRWEMGSSYLSPLKRKGRLIEKGSGRLSKSFTMIPANNKSEIEKGCRDG
jgi:hypothetical protein